MAASFSVQLLINIIQSSTRNPIIAIPGALKVFTLDPVIEITTNNYMNSTLINTIGAPIQTQTWMYLTIKASPSLESTSVSIYSNSVQIMFITVPGLFRMSEAAFILGLDQAYFFIGFIYSFEFYIGSVDLTNALVNYCQPGVLTNCIEDCPFMNYYENYLCSMCLSSCTEGCVKGTDCNLCYDTGCSDCLNFLPNTCILCEPSRTLINGVCQCSSGYYEVLGQCTQCEGSCSTCTGPYFTQCSLCSDSTYFLYNNTCVPICPNPCTVSSSRCIAMSLKVFDLRFNGLPSYSSIDIFSIGSDPLNFDTNDPLMQDLRGVYFKSISYIHSNLVLSYQFTLKFWIKIEYPGQIIKKPSFSIETSMTGTITAVIIINGIELINQISGIFKTWSFNELELKLNDILYSELTWYQSGTAINIITFSDGSRFIDYSGILFVGQSKDAIQVFNGFEGFLWSLTLLLGTRSGNEGSCLCDTLTIECPQELVCLSQNPFHYSTTNPTIECEEKCLTCNDPSICILCYPLYILNNGVCECTVGYQYNTISKICEKICNHFFSSTFLIYNHINKKPI